MWKRFFRPSAPADEGPAEQENGMRRRFGRRRRRPDEAGQGPIDPSWLERLVEAGLSPTAALERVEYEDVPPAFALTARGVDETGDAWILAVAPRSGGDAILAGLAVAARSGGPARVLAISEVWDGAARRRLGAVRGLAGAPRAHRLGDDDEASVTGETPSAPAHVEPGRLAAQIADPAARALFGRALDALRGLAAKHGGALRATSRSAELALLARRVAALRPEPGEVVLETFVGGRQAQRLRDDDLAEALDRLEGLLRKRLADREVREGEEGLRARALPALAEAVAPRFARRWPLGGEEADVIDLVGVAADDVPVVAAVRRRLTLRGLGEVLDAVDRLEPWLGELLAGAAPPVRAGAPRVALAAAQVDAAVLDAARHLEVSLQVLDLEERGAEIGLRPRELRSAPAPLAAAAPWTPSRRAEEAPARRERDVEAEAPESAPEEDGLAPRRRRRSRRRRRGGERQPWDEAGAEGAEAAEEGTGEFQDEGDPGAEEGAETGETAATGGFEEISVFDLDDEGGGDSRRRGRRRGRGRGRGRGRRDDAVRDDAVRDDAERPGDGPDGAEEAREAVAGDEDDERRPGRGRRRRRGRARAGREPAATTDARDDDGEADDEEILALSEAPELEETPLPSYDDDEEDEEDAGSPADRTRLEREQRRLARLAKLDPEPAVAEAVAEVTASLPRGRAALLAHADRESIAAALLLAREWRQLEGIWIYPQSELMTFFRSVATDLRDNTPILVIGFTPTPARDAIQAASLYQGRLAWFDHHDWPPEDRGALAEAIGPDHLHLVPGAGSALPVVLGYCTRRSRFSDKLVDLVTGRFSQHDFQRWGRLWWWRLGELTRKPGERRADLEALLVGRPSDLAKEAERLPAPPLPEEVEFVRARDFRLVHFGGLTLAVVEVPPALDAHLAARLVRERYDAPLSLARTQDEALLVLGSDDASSRRALDVGSMVEHLAEKFDWVEGLPDDDHVARLRVHGLDEQPDRLEEVIAEIGMGRSVLEG